MRTLSLFTSTGLWNLTLGETVVLFLAAVCVIFLIVFIIKCFATKRPVTIEIDGKVIEQAPEKNSKKKKKQQEVQIKEQQEEKKTTAQPYVPASATNTSFAYNYQMVDQTNMQNVIPSEYFINEPKKEQEPVTAKVEQTAQKVEQTIQEVDAVLPNQISMPISENEFVEKSAKPVKMTSALTQEEIEILAKCNIDASILNSQNNEDLLIIVKKIITKYRKNEILARIDKIQADINNLSAYISTVKQSATQN